MAMNPVKGWGGARKTFEKVAKSMLLNLQKAQNTCVPVIRPIGRHPFQFFGL